MSVNRSFSAFVKRVMLDGRADSDDKRNPICREGRRTFLRYDSIAIRAVPDEWLGAQTWEASFSWKGQEVFTLRGDRPWNSASGESLTLYGIDGHSEMFLSSL